MRDAFADHLAPALEPSDFRAGCPVVAVAVEADEDDPGGRRRGGAAFDRWEALVAQTLRRLGDPRRARAGRIATLAVAAIEGAVVQCRAAHRQPLTDVGNELETMLRLALDADGPRLRA